MEFGTADFDILMYLGQVIQGYRKCAASDLGPGHGLKDCSQPVR